MRAAILCNVMQVREARLQKTNAHDARHVHDCSHQCLAKGSEEASLSECTGMPPRIPRLRRSAIRCMNISNRGCQYGMQSARSHFMECYASSGAKTPES